MTVIEAIDRAAARLKRAGIEQPRLEAESLLAHALSRDAAWILAHPEHAMTNVGDRRFSKSVMQRAKRIPFAYVVGSKPFYGRDFLVTKDVLIPRPETETLVEAVLGLGSRFRGNDMGGGGNDIVKILDIGTGSGAIGLTLAAELPGSTAVLADVSTKALGVARRNARALKLLKRVRFIKMDVLGKGSFAPLRMTGRNHLIVVANLPYLPDTRMKTVSPEVRREPRLALVSGPDGLRHYRALVRRLAEQQLVPDLLAIEAEPEQMPRLETLLSDAFPEHRLRRHKDLYGDDRVLVASR